MSLPGYDAWRTGGDARSWPARITCRDCGYEFDGEESVEYGHGMIEPEECPSCGSQELDSAALDEVDIEERKLEARGEDF